MTDQQRAAQAVLDALQEYENLLEAEHPGPVAWTLFDPQIGTVATLRSCYPPDHQLPAPGQELLRNFWGALPSDEAWEADSPLRPEHVHVILYHLDRFRSWLVQHYGLGGQALNAPAQPSRQAENAPEHIPSPRPALLPSPEEEDDPEDTPGRIPPARRTRPLSMAEAARFMDLPGRTQKARVKRLRRYINDGTVRCKMLGRECYIFDLDDFPESAYPKVAPTGPK